MNRDSLFSERIIWAGGPKELHCSLLQKVTAWLLLCVALICALLAVAAAEAELQGGNNLVFFGAWCATLSLGIWKAPLIWQQAMRYQVTERHVIWQRGRFKRTMQRDGISYARITWNKHNPEIGDLDLVRAFPTGAFKRRLCLSLPGLIAPDRVWSIIRGVPSSFAGGNAQRPLAQRLDDGERVIWSAHPHKTWRAWLPTSARRLGFCALGVLNLFAAVHVVYVMAPLTKRLLDAGYSFGSIGFVALGAATCLTSLLLCAVTSAMLYLGIARQARLNRKTCYLVTDHRVLLSRGRQEIHLDRKNIVDVVIVDGQGAARDVYLVMDGPGSRAVAANGAFGPGERVDGFLPVLRGVQDVDGLRRALEFSEPTSSHPTDGKINYTEPA